MLLHVALFKGINKQQLQEYTSNPNANKNNAREGRVLRALEVKAMHTLLNRFAAILARGLSR